MNKGHQNGIKTLKNKFETQNRQNFYLGVSQYGQDIRIADLTAWHMECTNQSRKMVCFVRVSHHLSRQITIHNKEKK